ncbi:MAG TPA: secretion protein HlyD [Planctomicrobium sp.]|nr:secretion protein HlyD [Planctomicrobium sp.]
MTRKTVIVVIILLLLVGSGGYSWWRFMHHPDELASLTFHGNIDIREANLGFRVAGRVREVLKEEGDSVQAGDVLARLDAEPFQHAVDLACAQMESLAARLEELKNGNRPEEIAHAEATYTEQVAAVQRAQLIADRYRKLSTEQAISEQEYDNARADLDIAIGRRNAALANRDLMKAGFRREQILQAEANWQAARATLANAETQLADTEIIAPEAGVVLTRAVEPGVIVQAGTTALTLSLNSPVWARAYVTEPQLGEVYPGRKVLVFTDSRKEPYHGQIGDVSPRAEFTPKTVETKELRTSLVYRFRVVVSDADTGLRQGMPITVRLLDREQP